jgi:hypothetical protein
MLVARAEEKDCDVVARWTDGDTVHFVLASSSRNRRGSVGR